RPRLEQGRGEDVVGPPVRSHADRADVPGELSALLLAGEGRQEPPVVFQSCLNRQAPSIDRPTRLRRGQDLARQQTDLRRFRRLFLPGGLAGPADWLALRA